jgi:phosphoribosyl-ATP pyrophosphohydrolase
MEEITNFILKSAHKDRKTLAEQLIKLQEEAGELAAAYLMTRGKKGTTKTFQEIDDNFVEEACDTIIITLAILGKKKYSKERIYNMMNLKLQKWQSKLRK